MSGFYTRAIIIICLSQVYDEIYLMLRRNIINSLSEGSEIEEITIRLIKSSIDGIFKSLNLKAYENYNECYQGNIDYLEYSGISPENSFNIVHACEMLLLKSILDSYPNLDNTEISKVINYHFINKKDLLIISDIKNATIHYNPNYEYSGSV